MNISNGLFKVLENFYNLIDLYAIVSQVFWGAIFDFQFPCIYPGLANYLYCAKLNVFFEDMLLI